MRNVRMKLGIVVAVSVALQGGAARAEAPFDFDQAPGRLPKSVVPLDYDIRFAPDIATKTFTGSETVTLEVRKPTDRIVFNTLDITISRAQIDGKPVGAIDTQNTTQLTTLKAAATLPAGRHTLKLDYSGRIQERPQGLFAQAYSPTANNPGGTMLSTQFESTDARRLFPCWDEPAFRATFHLSATVPAGWATVSNTPIEKRTVAGKLATVSFGRTPKMSSYLVVFSAGDLKEVAEPASRAAGAPGRPVRLGIWAVSGREAEGRTALANAHQILADYDDYFGYPFPLPKLDSIAVPGGFSGAMENWGGITYTDQALLVSAASSLRDRQAVYSIQAHEMAHQWFGDLVTMAWWDDLWLNESFASWMAAKQTDRRNPGWKWWEHEDASKEAAMDADARASSHAIQVHVTDELQAANAFDPAITYNKGEAVLRMLEAWLGPDVFRDGVRRYMKARAFSNATTADLWSALSASSGQQVNQVAAGWTEQAGFPLVNVESRCVNGVRTVRFSQQRFMLRKPENASASSGQWRVPLQLRAGNHGTAQPVLLTQDDQSAPAGACDDALSANAGAVGYYRVHYDAATLAANTREFPNLPAGDRIALLDDQWAIAQATPGALGSYLALAGHMGPGLDARAWEQVTDALGRIEYDERGTPGHVAFVAYARTLLRPVGNSLGWDPRPGETPDVDNLRRQVLGQLGELGEPDVIDEARQRFTRYLKDPASMPPNQQELVLAVVGINADPATFDQLHALARAARDPAAQHRLYLALARVKDDQLAGQVAKIALSDELPPQDIQLRLNLIAALREHHSALAWSTFADHAEMLLSPAGNLAPLFEAQFVPELFWDSLPPEKMEAWIRAHVPQGMNEYIEKGMEGARLRYSIKQGLVPAADAWLAGQKKG